MALLRELGADAGRAARTFLRQPSTTLLIVSTLGLGIGTSGAVYAVFEHFLFREVPGVPSEAGLVTVIFQPPGERRTTAYGSPEGLPAMRQAATSLKALAYECCGDSLAVAAPAGTLPIVANGQFVTSQFFEVLGVRTRVGRLLTDDEADRATQDVILISEHLWRVALGGRADVVGSILTVNSHPFVLIGVLDGFRGWGATRVGDTDVWLPIGSRLAVTGSSWSMAELVGRAQRGFSLDVINQQLRAGYDRATQALPSRYRAFSPVAYPGLYTPGILQETGRRLYWLLTAGAGLLLILSCANAANLLLVRVGQRAQEIAVRLALGARPWRIVRHLSLEALELAGLAGGLGLAFAAGLTASLRGMRVVSWYPPISDITLDGRVLTFCLLITLATAVLFGLSPALVSSRSDVRGALLGTRRTVVPSSYFRNALVVVQLALSFVLTGGAAELNQSLRNLLATDLGMNLNDVAEVALRPDDFGYDRDGSASALARAMTGLRDAGFPDVAMSFPEPLTTSREIISVKTAAMVRTEDRTVVDMSVSAAYFRVLKIPILAGRVFTDEENRERGGRGLMPVVLSVGFARDIFGNQSAVGRAFDLDRHSGMRTISATAVVIGVVGDTRSGAIRLAPPFVVYHMREPTWRYGTILVRSDEPIGRLIPQIRSVVHDVDPGLPITSIAPIADDVAEELSEDRALARFGAVAGLLGALLASAGVFSTINKSVTERRRDLGIRSALGASTRDILQLILREAVGLSVTGLVLGLCLFSGLSRGLEHRLFGLRPVDISTLSAAAFALFIIAIVAALVPAFRAARVDPASALRLDS